MGLRRFWVSGTVLAATTELGESIRILLLLGLLAAMQPGVADPRLGSWTLISAESSLDPPNRLSITPLHDGVHVVMSGETHLDFTANWNGHQSSAPGNLAFNQIELRRIDKKQAEVKEKKDGIVVATVREKVSDDGNELTTTTATAGLADKINVWTRSGGKKVANDFFAGEWTQDLSKTRLRQGLVLKIQTDGSGGIRFLGDFSYTARFDGKPYDLKNSRNDTVTLELVDPHTVDARNRGLSARIFRPALVSPSVTGGGNNFDIAVRLVAFMVNHGNGVDTLNQVSFVPADIVANNIVAISTTPGTANKTYHVTRDDYSNMMDITRLITKATGRQFETFRLPDFVPELIRRCRKEDLLFPLLDFLVGSVDNISAMEFKRYDSSSYRLARDASVWGKADPSLEDTVNGILKFMYRKGIISVAAREINALSPSDRLRGCTDAISATAS